MLQFLTIIERPEKAEPAPKERVQDGTLIETGRRLATNVRLAVVRVTVMDGPFSETKELIGGRAVATR